MSSRSGYRPNSMHMLCTSAKADEMRTFKRTMFFTGKCHKVEQELVFTCRVVYEHGPKADLERETDKYAFPVGAGTCP